MNNIIYTPFLNYLRIASEALDKLVCYVKSEGTTWSESDTYEKSADGQATIVVVFTAIALECYIQNYATRKLGKKFCDKHIESMGHHTKWLLVPKLATGKTIPADHKAIALLKTLIAARNNVIHSKAVNLDAERLNEQKERIVAHQQAVIDAALVAFRCVGELGSLLSNIDPDEPSAKILAGYLNFPKLSMRTKSRTKQEKAQQED
jgi:hypothetical protein